MVTCPDTDVAGAIAEACVSECLAACVNLLPGLTSVYRWEGAVHKDSEALLLLKTHRGLLEALKGRVVALHPYSVPEFVVLPIVAGSREYLGWMAELLRNP
ncbi:MAG: divalent-cation tolerance protein CutA [Candidatus Melainabacteria bacterium]